MGLQAFPQTYCKAYGKGSKNADLNLIFAVVKIYLKGTPKII